ncbi:MAG: hypothetical protein AAF750_18405 [Planctomycetota bacterium]
MQPAPPSIPSPEQHVMLRTALAVAAAAPLLVLSACETTGDPNPAQTKAEEKADRAANRAESRIDQKTDSAIDRAIDNIFD